MSLHSRLLDLRLKGPSSPGHGICINIKPHQKSDVAILIGLFPNWPLYSGDKVHPIRSHDPSRSASEAYHQSSDLQMWHPAHPYGAARLALLDWLIEQADPQSSTRKVTP